MNGFCLLFRHPSCYFRAASVVIKTTAISTCYVVNESFVVGVRQIMPGLTCLNSVYYPSASTASAFRASYGIPLDVSHCRSLMLAPQSAGRSLRRGSWTDASQVLIFASRFNASQDFNGPAPPCASLYF